MTQAATNRSKTASASSGPGRPFRVVLDRLDRQVAVAQALDRPVVEVDLADVEPAGPGQRVGDDLDLVVLGGHLDEPAVHVADRMVRPVMAEPQPAGVGPRRAAHDLVTEADPEQRPAVGDGRPGQRHRPGEPGWIPWARRQDEPVHVGGQRVGRRHGVGQDPDPRSPPPSERTMFALSPKSTIATSGPPSPHAPTSRGASGET